VKTAAGDRGWASRDGAAHRLPLPSATSRRSSGRRRTAALSKRTYIFSSLSRGASRITLCLHLPRGRRTLAPQRRHAQQDLSPTSTSRARSDTGDRITMGQTTDRRGGAIVTDIVVTRPRAWHLAWYARSAQQHRYFTQDYRLRNALGAPAAGAPSPISCLTICGAYAA